MLLREAETYHRKPELTQGFILTTNTSNEANMMGYHKKILK